MQFLRGTLDLLILSALYTRGMHGYEVARWLEATTDDALTIEEGSLYPALHRMTRKGWIEGEWGVTDENRRVKVYRLTSTGRTQLRNASDGWRKFATSVSRVLETVPTA